MTENNDQTQKSPIVGRTVWDIAVSSSPDTGSVFTLSLPLPKFQEFEREGKPLPDRAETREEGLWDRERLAEWISEQFRERPKVREGLLNRKLEILRVLNSSESKTKKRKKNG